MPKTRAKSGDFFMVNPFDQMLQGAGSAADKTTKSRDLNRARQALDAFGGPSMEACTSAARGIARRPVAASAMEKMSQRLEVKSEPADPQASRGEDQIPRLVGRSRKKRWVFRGRIWQLSRPWEGELLNRAAARAQRSTLVVKINVRGSTMRNDCRPVS